MAGDVFGQARQGREDADIVLVVRTQLESVAFGYDKRYFEDVYGVEAEALAVKGRIRLDRIRLDLEIEAFHQ